MLAHLSDPHLPPLPVPRLGDLVGKRALGYLNWTRNRHKYQRREVLDALVSDVQRQEPDHIAITGDFVNQWQNRLLNIHPALLPAFKGLDTHKRALGAGVKVHGATVHFVVAEMDSGPIIMQGAVAVRDNDSEAALSARVLAMEHRIYPRALSLVAQGRVRVVDGRCLIDDVPVPEDGYPGEYMVELAQAIKRGHGDALLRPATARTWACGSCERAIGHDEPSAGTGALAGPRAVVGETAAGAWAGEGPREEQGNEGPRRGDVRERRRPRVSAPAQCRERRRSAASAGASARMRRGCGSVARMSRLSARPCGVVAELGSDAQVGFHGHENVGLGVANSVLAYRAGARQIDGSTRSSRAGRCGSHQFHRPNSETIAGTINVFHMTMFAEFLDKLAAIPEGDGSVLDHSMIVYGSGISDGNRHNHDDLPVLLAGKGGGTIKTGRHVVYPRRTPLNNLYLSMLERLDDRWGKHFCRRGRFSGAARPFDRLQHSARRPPRRAAAWPAARGPQTYLLDE